MEEIINSVMQSPENTNPNILRSQLQKMGSSGGGGVLIGTSGSESGTFVVDMPITEVAAAMEKGAKIAVHVESNGEQVGCVLVEFYGWYKNGGTMRIMAYSIVVDLTTEITSFVGMADGNITKFKRMPHS